jgi:hypothetical protein
MKEREWLSLPFTPGRAEENRIKTSQHVGILGWSRMTISLKPNEGDKAVCRGKDVVWWAWPVLSNAASWGRVQLSIWPPLQAEGPISIHCMCQLPHHFVFSWSQRYGECENLSSVYSVPHWQNKLGLSALHWRSTSPTFEMANLVSQFLFFSQNCPCTDIWLHSDMKLIQNVYSTLGSFLSSIFTVRKK